MPSELLSLDFSADLARLTTNFTGREWLIDRLAELFHRPKQQLVVLTGEPGIGKSALCARLIGARNDIAAYHFCFARRSSTITPASVVRSLARQLGDRLPGFAEALLANLKPMQLTINIELRLKQVEKGASVTGLLINHVVTRDADEDFEILIRAPLAAMPAPAQAIILLVDGLDEALSYRATPNLVDLIGAVHGLPAWVTLFCTTRRSDSVLSHLQPLRPLILDATFPSNQSDVRQYVGRRLSTAPIQQWLLEASADSTQIASRIVARAAGNFLYARVLLDRIASEGLPASVEDFPVGLDAIYQHFLRRFSDWDWDNLYQPLLGKLSVAQEPLSEDQLAGMTGIAATRVRRALGVLDQYLNPIPIRAGGLGYELFHESLRGFLLSKEVAGRYWCSADEEHGGFIAHFTGGDGNWNEAQSYAIRHLPFHLKKARRTAELIALLASYPWLTEKLERTSVYELLADLDLAPPEDRLEAVASIIRLSALALENDKGQLWPQFSIRSLERQNNPLTDFPPAPYQGWLRLLSPTVRQARDPLTWVFRNHGDLVKDVCAVPHAPLVVSCSFDRTIRVWDLKAGREIRRLEGHTDTVSSIAVSMDGSRIFSGGRDQTVRVWELQTAKMIRVIDGLPGWAEPLCVSSDDRYLAVVVGEKDYSSTIRIWEGPNQEKVRIYSRKQPVGAIAFIPHTSWLAERCDEQIVVWDVASGEEIRRFPYGFKSFLYSPSALAVSPDGRWLAAGGSVDDGRLKVFHLFDEGSFALPTDRQGVPTKLAFSPNGRLLLCAGKPWQILPENNLIDDYLRVWDLQTRNCKARYPHDGVLQAVTVSADNTFAISATGNRKISVWRLDRETGVRPGHSGRVVQVCARAGSAFTAAIDGSVFAWDLGSYLGKPVARSGLPLLAIEVSADGTLLASSAWEYSVIENSSVFSCEVALHRLGSCKNTTALVNLHESLNRHSYPALAMLPNQNRMFMVLHAPEADRHGAVEIWDMESAKIIASMPYPGRSISSVLPFRDGNRVLTTAGDLCLWFSDDLSSGRRVLLDESAAIACLALSDDEKLIAVGSFRGAVEVWELSNMRQLAHYEAHQGAVTGLRFAGEGATIGSVGRDQSLKVYDWKRSQPLASFFGDGAFEALGFDPLRRVFIIGEESGAVHFVRLEEGQGVAARPHSNPLPRMSP